MATHASRTDASQPPHVSCAAWSAPPSPATADGDGVRVIGVDPRGPSADKLLPGDRIVAANRVPVDAPATLTEVLEATADRVILDVRRGQRRVFIAVPLRK